MKTETKILRSLKTASILGAGQSLDRLVFVAFNNTYLGSKEKTQKILRKLKREEKVFFNGSVWVLDYDYRKGVKLK